MESLAQSQHEVALLPWRIDSFEVFQESRNDIVTYHLQKAKIASKLLLTLGQTPDSISLPKLQRSTSKLFLEAGPFVHICLQIGSRFFQIAHIKNSSQL